MEPTIEIVVETIEEIYSVIKYTPLKTRLTRPYKQFTKLLNDILQLTPSRVLHSYQSESWYYVAFNTKIFRLKSLLCQPECPSWILEVEPEINIIFTNWIHL